MRRTTKRLGALFLSALMLLSAMSTGALAADEASEEIAEEFVEEKDDTSAEMEISRELASVTPPPEPNMATDTVPGGDSDSDSDSDPDKDFVVENGVSIKSSGDCGDNGSNVTWTLDSEGILTISGTGAMRYFVQSPWYAYREEITTVVIQNGVTSISQQVFAGCISLTSVTIPDSVTSIGWGAFRPCPALTSVTIPDSVTSIEASAFQGCTSLTSVTIPGSLTHIDNAIFFECTGLTSVTIQDGVTSIGGSAFADCASLTSVTIPDSVTSIGNSAFQRCSSLASVTFVGDAPTIEEEYGYVGVFQDVTATVYYPAGNSTWTNTAKNEFGKYANLTWMAYGETLTSEDGSVTVENSGGKAWRDGVTLVVEPLTNDILIGKVMRIKGIVKYIAYDITLKRDGVEIQPDGSVRVKIAVPAGFDGTKCVIYHMDADGNLEKIACTYEDGPLRFTTNHFSTYIVAEEATTTPDQGSTESGNSDGTHKPAPKTGDETNMSLYVLMLILCSAGLCAVTARKRKEN